MPWAAPGVSQQAVQYPRFSRYLFRSARGGTTGTGRNKNRRFYRKNAQKTQKQDIKHPARFAASQVAEVRA